MNPENDPQAALDQAWKAWRSAAHETALQLISAAYERWPDNFSIAYAYAQFLGDTHDSGPERDEAVRILKKLCGKLRSRTPEERWKVRRHYYIFSGQHLRNRELGKAEVARGNPSGVQSIAFGCLHHALELCKNGQRAAALPFAREAELAFQQLFQVDAPIFSRFLAYAVALHLQGKKDEAQKARQVAMELIGVDAQHPAFQAHEALLKSL